MPFEIIPRLYLMIPILFIGPAQRGPVNPQRTACAACRAHLPQFKSSDPSTPLLVIFTERINSSSVSKCMAHVFRLTQIATRSVRTSPETHDICTMDRKPGNIYLIRTVVVPYNALRVNPLGSPGQRHHRDMEQTVDRKYRIWPVTCNSEGDPVIKSGWRV